MLEEDPSKISKAQYDKLLGKYEQLLKKHRKVNGLGRSLVSMVVNLKTLSTI